MGKQNICLDKCWLTQELKQRNFKSMKQQLAPVNPSSRLKKPHDGSAVNISKSSGMLYNFSNITPYTLTYTSLYDIHRAGVLTGMCVISGSGQIISHSLSLGKNTSRIWLLQTATLRMLRSVPICLQRCPKTVLNISIISGLHKTPSSAPEGSFIEVICVLFSLLRHIHTIVTIWLHWKHKRCQLHHHLPW